MAFKDLLIPVAEERGVNQSELARRLKLSSSAVNQWWSGEITPRLPRILQIAKALDVPPVYLLLEDQGPLPNATVAPDAPDLPAAGSMARDVPVYGTAQGGPDGAFEINMGGGPIDWARRPLPLVGMKSVFAIYVEGDSMVPWRQPGELVYVQRGRAPAIGNHVVVVREGDGPGQPPTAIIKQLSKRTATRIELVQYNPPKTIHVQADKVKELYRVLEWSEVLGI